MEFDLINRKAELDQIVRRVCALAEQQGKLSAFCIGNTRKINESGLYFSPIRITGRMVAGSVIVYADDHARWIAQQIDGRVDYLLVDTEKKSSPIEGTSISNVEREVREVVVKSRLLTYKGNDLTVDSIEQLIVQLVSVHPRGLGGKRAVIIGAGNVGSKLALKLVERGMEVTLTRRDDNKLRAIVAALNIIKPSETIAAVSGTTDNLYAAKGADLLIGLTHGVAAITPEMIDRVNHGAFLLDAGKGCFSSDAIYRARARGMAIYRADVRPGFEGHSAMALITEDICRNGIGRRMIAGIPVVSGGLLGDENEIIVDKVSDPTTVFGVANGLGDFVRNLDDMQLNAIRIVQDYIDRRKSN